MSSARLRVRPPSRAAIATLAIALTVAACSKGEPETSSKPRPNVPLQESKPAAPATSQAESSEGLRERLARQEAASKMFDKTPEPPKPAARAPEPPKPEPTKAEPAKPVAKAPEPPKPEPVKVEPPKPEPPKVEAPKPEPPKPAPAAEPKAPPAAPATRLVSRVDPDFPREAVQAGATTGTVKARLTLDAAGNVTQVEVTEATPRRIFDRAVMRALSQWKYNEGAPTRYVDVEIVFKQQ